MVEYTRSYIASKESTKVIVCFISLVKPSISYSASSASIMADLAPSAPDSLPVTPGTRSEAEAAFLSNILTQTASAGAAPSVDGEAVKSSITGRPPFPTRSSYNYADATVTSALDIVNSNESNRMPSDNAPAAQLAPRPKAIKMPTSPSDADLAAQNAAAEQAWLNEQAAAKRTSVDMRSDSIVGILEGNETRRPPAHVRQQSWNQEDMKRSRQEPLMKGGGEGAVYGYTGQEGGVTGA